MEKDLEPHCQEGNVEEQPDPQRSPALTSPTRSYRVSGEKSTQEFESGVEFNSNEDLGEENITKITQRRRISFNKLANEKKKDKEENSGVAENNDEVAMDEDTSKKAYMSELSFHTVLRDQNQETSPKMMKEEKIEEESGKGKEKMEVEVEINIEECVGEDYGRETEGHHSLGLVLGEAFSMHTEELQTTTEEELQSGPGEGGTLEGDEEEWRDQMEIRYCEDEETEEQPEWESDSDVICLDSDSGDKNVIDEEEGEPSEGSKSLIEKPRIMKINIPLPCYYDMLREGIIRVSSSSNSEEETSDHNSEEEDSADYDMQEEEESKGRDQEREVDVLYGEKMPDARVGKEYLRETEGQQSMGLVLGEPFSLNTEDPRELGEKEEVVESRPGEKIKLVGDEEERRDQMEEQNFKEGNISTETPEGRTKTDIICLYSHCGDKNEVDEREGKSSDRGESSIKESGSGKDQMVFYHNCRNTTGRLSSISKKKQKKLYNPDDVNADYTGKRRKNWKNKNTNND